MTLVDSNVLIDIFTDDSRWVDWSSEALITALQAGEVGINPIIFAEISVAFSEAAELERAIAPLGLLRWDLPYSAAFSAGAAFLSYRKAGGSRRSPLPDFYIGAHAYETGLRLLTRDARRYRSYFPELKLICPEPEA